ncbi:MAG: class I SAM-dependent methyltransferase, partial [Bacteroidota bacterium]
KSTTSKNLLVVGCGTGAEIQRFSSEWQITGLDPSPDMIIQARQNLYDFKNVSLIEGVVSDLNHSNPFGAATLLLVLHFMEDDGTKLQLLMDIAKRLETGSPFVILDITGHKEQIKGNLNILKSILPEELSDEDVQDRLNRIKTQLHAVSEERLIELLVLSGFEKPLRFFQNSIYMGWMTKKL